MILLPVNRRPAGALRLDRSNPLANGLISAWVPGQLFSRIPRPANGGTPTTGLYGLGASFNGTSDSVTLGPRALAHSSPDSRFALIRVGSASGARNISAGGNNGVGFRTNGTALEVLQSSVAITLSAAAAVTSSEFCSVGMVNASALAELYKNGNRIGANTSGGLRTDNGTDFIGQSGASSQYWDGSVFLHLAWNRVLTAGEMAQLHANPWQIFAPQIIWIDSPASGGVTVTPTKGTLTHTGKQPTITQTANQTVAPAKGTLTFTGYTPTVTQTANQTVAPAKGTLTFTGYTPTVTQTANQTVAPVKGTLTFTGYTPTVTQDSGTVIYPAKGTLTHTGKQPAITQTANQIIVPTKGTLTFTGKQPTVTQTGGVTYTRAPRGAGYPGARPAIERYGMTNTSRSATTNTRR